MNERAAAKHVSLCDPDSTCIKDTLRKTHQSDYVSLAVMLQSFPHQIPDGHIIGDVDRGELAPHGWVDSFGIATHCTSKSCRRLCHQVKQVAVSLCCTQYDDMLMCTFTCDLSAGWPGKVQYSKFVTRWLLSNTT